MQLYPRYFFQLKFALKQGNDTLGLACLSKITFDMIK